MSYIPEEIDPDKRLGTRQFHFPLLMPHPENDKDHFIAESRYIDLLATEIRPIAFLTR